MLGILNYHLHIFHLRRYQTTVQVILKMWRGRTGIGHAWTWREGGLTRSKQASNTLQMLPDGGQKERT